MSGNDVMAMENLHSQAHKMYCLYTAWHPNFLIEPFWSEKGDEICKFWSENGYVLPSCMKMNIHV